MCLTLKYNYLLKYYPTTCNFHADDEIWNDRYIVWNFKNTPVKTSPLQHQQALNYVIPRITTILEQTFGSKLSEITLFCIPASSEEKNKRRYEEFSEILCNNTGMQNAFTHIKIRGERGAKHEGVYGGDQQIMLENDFFRKKNILLFDDVITSGQSMKYWKSELENKLKANVIAAFAIGLTTHIYKNINTYGLF